MAEVEAQPVQEQQQEPRQKKRVKCRLCKKEGHNIRSCNLFEESKRAAIYQYESWLHHCIVSFTTPQDDRVTFEGLIEPDDELVALFQEQQNEPDGLEKILKTPTKWLKNIDEMAYNGLVHGYCINKNGRREDIILLLHYILLSEADVRWMRSFDIEKALPYIIKSKTYLNHLEHVNMNIITFDILMNNLPIIASLHSDVARDDRIRSLYYSSTRSLQYTYQDLTRNDRRLQDVERGLRRAQYEYNTVIEQRDSITQRRDFYMHELSLFPPGCLKPQIKINKCHNSHVIECPICYETTDKDTYVKLHCAHEYCVNCILNTILKKYNRNSHTLQCDCPMCRKPIHNLYGNIDIIKSHFESLKESHRISNHLLDIIG